MRPGGAGPAAAALREAKTHERVGGDRCVICGESEFSVLMKSDPKLLEQHHIGGRNHDTDLTGPLCRNCHAKAHEALRVGGVDLEQQEDRWERLKQWLLAIGCFLIELGKGVLAMVDRTWQEVEA